MDAELRQEPTANESAGNADEEVTDQPEPGALHDLTCKPSGNKADNDYNQQTFTRHVHLYFSSTIRIRANCMPPAVRIQLAQTFSLQPGEDKGVLPRRSGGV